MQTIKILGIGGVLAFLTACGTPSNNLAPQKPQDGLLELCLGMPEGVPGETNESLAQGFLVNREGLRTCQGVVRAIKNGGTRGTEEQAQ